ncbi:MAG: MBL fold metallo-hydrolase, partial [Clostridiales bacterium]|nr:MBL fold metallo-hydrolase [Clostridiales bacterium]
SVGLQLSFTAMFGMLTVAPAIYRAITKWAFAAGKQKGKAGLPQRFYKNTALAVLAAFSSTLGALSFSTPIAALYFGYFSLIGILVNALIFALVSASFILGYLSCIIGVAWLSFGEVLGAVTSFFAELMIKIISLGAKAPYAALYTEGSAFGMWLILVYAIIILCYIFRPKKGFRPYIPLSLAVISLCSVIIIYEIRLEHSPDTVRIIDVGQGQSLILTSGRHTAVIDCGGKGKLGNAGDTVAARLLREGRRSIDFLALTHFDDDHVNGVIRLMCRIEVERILIPPDDFERSACIEILEFAASKGVPVYVINEDSEVKAGDMELFVFAPEDDKLKALMYLGKLKEFELMVTGDAYSSDERRLLRRQELPDVDLMIAGHHGSKYSSSEGLLKALRAEYAAVSSGYNNYGHPAPEALGRFAKAGMAVYRTDLHGDIVFYIS